MVWGLNIYLTQSYLKQKLTVSNETRGIVLEVTEEPGLGDTANIILTDGVLNKYDEIAVAKKDGVVTTKIKAIFMPKPLDEMRDPRDKFTPVDQVVAASGVKISTSDLDGVLGGSPIIGITSTTKGHNPITISANFNLNQTIKNIDESIQLPST